MKKTLITLLSLALTGTILSSCEECGDPIITAPTVDDTEWLVYAKGDSAIFEDEAGNRVKYTAVDSASQTVIGEGLAPDEECFDKLDTKIIVILKDAEETLPDIATFVYKTPTRLEVRLAVQDSEAKELSISSPTYVTKEINGATYSDVFELNLQKERVYSAKQILFNKEHGFLRIEFHDGTFIEKLPS